jgi:hypothetical protein
MCVMEMKRGEEFFICTLKRKVPEKLDGLNEDCAKAVLFAAHHVKHDVKRGLPGGGVNTVATVDGGLSGGEQKPVTWM